MREDDDVIVCRCQEITRGEVRQAIAEGALTVSGVKRRTRAGMGLCQGKTCQRMIERMIAEETGKPLSGILPATYRAPVRPIPAGAFLPREDEQKTFSPNGEGEV